MRVRVRPYEDVRAYIQKSLIGTGHGEAPIWLSGGSSERIFEAIPKRQRQRFTQASPVTKVKAIKNQAEVRNMKNFHVRDAASLCEFLAWLEDMVARHPEGHEQLWKIAAADHLESCREQQEQFIGLSFPSISSSGPNGDVIRYHPPEETKQPINQRELYLIDAGAQYLDGTIDVTRTVDSGDLSEADKYKDAFTLVLQGHIQLAIAVFPGLIEGSQLARQYLWQQGLDYLHDTGHGVGMFLNVHEGPASISPRPPLDDPGFEAGQVLSNDPGFYEDGVLGIRIKDLVVTRALQRKYNFNNRGKLKFETITLVLRQAKLIDARLLTEDELGWLNDNHWTCREVVGAHLDRTNKPKVQQGLVEATRELVRA